MPHYKRYMICWFAALAVAAGGSLTCWAQTPDFSEPWVEEPVYFGFDEVPTSIFAITGQMLWLNRSESFHGNQPLVTGDTDVDIGGGVILTFTENLVVMGDLNLPTEAGIRFSLLFGPPTGRYFEVTYSGIFDQDATVTVAPDFVDRTDQYFFGASPLTETNIFQHTVTYENDLHSLEFNVWSDLEFWRLRPFIGARWISQTDKFQVRETQSPGDGGFAEFTNHLFGCQTGFATVLWQRADWFNVQAIGKVGAFHNEMDLDASVSDLGVPFATLSRDLGAVCGSGQIDVTAIWQITPYFSFQVGYTGLWLSEVGVAGDQNDSIDILTGTGEVDLGGISYQGGHFGGDFGVVAGGNSNDQAPMTNVQGNS